LYCLQYPLYFLYILPQPYLPADGISFRRDAECNRLVNNFYIFVNGIKCISRVVKNEQGNRVPFLGKEISCCDDSFFITAGYMQVGTGDDDMTLWRQGL